MKPSSLNDLLLDAVRDIYDAEKQLLKALPKMADAAETPQLKEAFEQHLGQTRTHVERLEQVFELLEHAPRGKKCHAMQGLIEEGKEVIEMEAEPDVRDAALIGAAQKVEHYEIATYGTLCTWASLLGLEDIKSVMGQTLEEEKSADELLTRVAEDSVNLKSAAAG